MTDYSVYEGTRPVAEAHRFDVAALERYMREHVEGFRGPLRVEQFRGGLWTPTFRLVAGDGKSYVMRSKPPG
jgi:aminoglycoside phosphotransferase (APT) family kinase protein